ncbi:alpha/beta hydrolase [Streptomyces sp. NPDC090057]|uniref:alpha/beta hydrolase n=1 Tax=Streptomyces sp. NPDC090057 TaxID=3365935 RepID=UPI00381DA267
METVTFKNKHVDVAADIHFPPGFDPERKYSAIVSAHPVGSCKEQTSGSVYGKAFAKAGFVVLAFDAAFQAGSGGEPRQLEVSKYFFGHHCAHQGASTVPEADWAPPPFGEIDSALGGRR